MSNETETRKATLTSAVDELALAGKDVQGTAQQVRRLNIAITNAIEAAHLSPQPSARVKTVNQTATDKP